MATPRLFLDTNVCEKLSSPAHGFDSQGIVQRLADKFSIVVSPRSLFELLQGVVGGTTDEHLRSDQTKLLTLLGHQRPTFLELPGHFALRTVLGVISSVPCMTPTDFVQIVTTVGAARSLRELFDGKVRIPGDSTATYGLDRNIVAAEKEEDSKTHREWLSFAKERTDNFGTPEAWAYLVGVAHGVRLTDMQNMYFAKCLSAAFEYERTNFNIAANNPNLNIGKRDSDWGDFQQLFYLCDPSLHLLTDDEGIRTKCKASEQSKRIILLKEA
jgi:hypothetical protein